MGDDGTLSQEQFYDPKLMETNFQFLDNSDAFPSDLGCPQTSSSTPPTTGDPMLIHSNLQFLDTTTPPGYCYNGDSGAFPSDLGCPQTAYDPNQQLDTTEESAMRQTQYCDPMQMYAQPPYMVPIVFNPMLNQFQMMVMQIQNDSSNYQAQNLLQVQTMKSETYSRKKSWSLDRHHSLPKDRSTIIPLPMSLKLSSGVEVETPRITLNAWAPFANNMTSGLQTISTRSYQLPLECTNVACGIVQIRPKHSANYRPPCMIGEVVFSGSVVYQNKEEWYEDSDKHLNDAEKNWSHSYQKKYGWVIESYRTYENDIIEASSEIVDGRFNYMHNFFMFKFDVKSSNERKRG